MGKERVNTTRYYYMANDQCRNYQCRLFWYWICEQIPRAVKISLVFKSSYVISQSQFPTKTPY